MARSELKQRQRKDYGFSQVYQTRWSDNDMYDHMNNSIYYFLFDSIVNSYLIQHCCLNPPTSSQIGLVVHSHCDFFGSLSFPSTVELGLRVNSLGNSSVQYEIGVFEHGVKEAKAVGGFIHVFVERANNKPHAEGMNKTTRTGLERLMMKEKAKL